MNQGSRNWVRKYGQNSRNLERINTLVNINLPLPKIYTVTSDWYDMEYIPHINMTNWLIHNHIDAFISWMCLVIDRLSTSSRIKDYTKVYNEKLNELNSLDCKSELPFTFDQLLVCLPKELPQSYYHGDLTMENCLYGTNGKFYLIDPLTTVYDSWVFDVSKLMQDLECGWFIRNSTIRIQPKLWSIRSALLQRYPLANNPYLLILMLLRILPYAKNTSDQRFLINEIKQLWK